MPPVTTTNTLFWIDLGLHQLEMGTSCYIFKLNPSRWEGLYRETVVAKLWKNLATYRATIKIHNKPEISISRSGDKFTMEICVGARLTTLDLKNFNEIRKHLKIILISDIVNLRGTNIKSEVYERITRYFHMEWLKTFMKLN